MRESRQGFNRLVATPGTEERIEHSLYIGIIVMNDALLPLLGEPKAHADYYRARAEEVRKRAASIKSAITRLRFLEVAQTYDRLALAVENATGKADASDKSGQFAPHA